VEIVSDQNFLSLKRWLLNINIVSDLMIYLKSDLH